MKGTEALLYLALGSGGLGGLLGALRLFRRDVTNDRSGKVEAADRASVALLEGYGGIYDRLSKEVQAVKDATARELREQDERHAAERREWYAERAELRAEVRELRDLVAEWQEANLPRSTARRDRRGDHGAEDVPSSEPIDTGLPLRDDPDLLGE